MYLLSPRIFICYNCQHQKAECFCSNISSTIFILHVMLGNLTFFSLSFPLSKMKVNIIMGLK